MATQADREQLTGVKDEYRYGFYDTQTPFFKAERGLNHIEEELANVGHAASVSKIGDIRTAAGLARMTRRP